MNRQNRLLTVLTFITLVTTSTAAIVQVWLAWKRGELPSLEPTVLQSLSLYTQEYLADEGAAGIFFLVFGAAWLVFSLNFLVALLRMLASGSRVMLWPGDWDYAINRITLPTMIIALLIGLLIRWI